MPRRLVSVGDDYTLPAAVKAADANLPTRLSDASLNTKILDKINAEVPGMIPVSSPTTALAEAVSDVSIGADPSATFNHYGDSMTANWTSGAWVEKLAELTGQPNYPGGVGGETAQQILDRVLADTTANNRRFTYGMGRNDVGLTTPVADVVADVRAAVDHITTKRLGIVFDIAPWDDEGTDATGSGLTNRNRRLAMDDELAKRFPVHFEPVYAWLRTQAAADAAGITFTADDLADIAKGITPRCFRLRETWASGYDGGHTNAYGGAAFYYRVAQVLHERRIISQLPIAVKIHAHDYFHRADNASIGNVDHGGLAWNVVAGTWSIITKTLQVVGAASTDSIAYVNDATLNNFVCVAEVNNSDVGILYKGNGADRYVAYAESGVYTIRKRVGGTYTTIGTPAANAPTPTATRRRLMIRYVNGEHRLYVDGILASTATDSTLTGTRYGLWKYNTGTRRIYTFELRESIGS